MRPPRPAPYGRAMDDEDDKPGWIRARLHIIIGVAGLFWFAMLWFMFGDVL